MPKARTARNPGGTSASRTSSSPRSSVTRPTKSAAVETAVTSVEPKRPHDAEASSEVWQARLSKQDADELRNDLETLGLTSRSELIKAGLHLLHRQAAEERMASDVEEFHGHQPVPLSPFVARSPQRPQGA